MKADREAETSAGNLARVRDGVCPKCQATDVHASRSGLPLAGGAQARVHAHFEPGFRGVRASHGTQDLWQFLCGACGYVETYLLDGAAIDFVRRTWLPIPPAATPSAG